MAIAPKNSSTQQQNDQYVSAYVQSVYRVEEGHWDTFRNAPRSPKFARSASFDQNGGYIPLIVKKAQDEAFTASEINLLIKIAWCESGISQKWNYMNPTGDHTSKWSAYGLFQIIASHEKTFGISRMTPEGNISIALSLFKKNGTRDWNESKSCWQQ